MQSPDYQGMRQHLPAPLQVFTPFAKLTPPRQGKCPEKQRQGSAEYEERPGNEHQHFMLDHVCGEEHGSERVQRRDECYPKRAPSAPKSQALPMAYPTLPRRGVPQCSPATQVEAGEQDKAP